MLSACGVSVATALMWSVVFKHCIVFFTTGSWCLIKVVSPQYLAFSNMLYEFRYLRIKMRWLNVSSIVFWKRHPTCHIRWISILLTGSQYHLDKHWNWLSSKLFVCIVFILDVLISHVTSRDATMRSHDNVSIRYCQNICCSLYRVRIGTIWDSMAYWYFLGRPYAISPLLSSTELYQYYAHLMGHYTVICAANWNP